MKKLIKDQWLALKVFNSWEIAKRGSRVFIGYRAGRDSRSGVSAAWQVLRIGQNGQEIKTDPETHWMNYGRKTFYVRGRDDKDAKLAEAMEWARDQFGIAEWERGPWGAYHPKGDLEKAAQ